DMRADPLEQHDTAATQPEVVTRLRADYQRWWKDIAPGIRRPVAIPLGLAAENPTRLTCYEWHTGHWIAKQAEVIARKPANGFWAVEVPQAGRYAFTLRQQPLEAPCPIAGEEARIRVGGLERTARVPAGAEAVTFELDLPAGRTSLETWLAP